MPDVSRETSEGRAAPAMPAVASELFPADRVHLAAAYAELLADDGVVRGLIGPREAPRLWERHLLNCAALAELVPPGASVCDLGSGAGLPGLVVAIARPDVQVTLVEPLLRRTTFLQEVVDRLELEAVRVVRGRADALHGEETFDVVTSRAVAPLPRLLEWSMPLVAGHGAMVAMKGSSVAAEIEEARTVLHSLGCGEPETLLIGENVPLAATTVVRVTWAVPGQVGWRSVTRAARDDRPDRSGSAGRGRRGSGRPGRGHRR